MAPGDTSRCLAPGHGRAADEPADTRLRELELASGGGSASRRAASRCGSGERSSARGLQPSHYDEGVRRGMRRSDARTRWDEDNRVPLNPAVFVVFAGLALVLAGLFLLFAFVL